MLVLSSSSPPSLELFRDRVSSSSFSSSSSSSSSPSSFLFAFRRYRTSSRFLVCFVSSLSSKLRLTANAAFPTSPVVAEVVGADGVVNNHTVFNGVHSRAFVDARSGEELLTGIRRESETGKLPVTVASSLMEVYQNYRDAVLSSENPQADEVILSNMSAMLDLVMLDVEDPFQFQPHHKAIREPIDYYMFGQNYLRPLVDFGNSYVGNVSVFSEMESKLQQGHNIILMSNHQTEADPAIIALLLEKTNPYIAENLIYVAGDRVVTDPLCKPFSMGRNLLCVYSKKHLYDVPELVDMKRRANTRSLKEMALLLRRGSQIIWIAPSGGRDRPDPVTEEWYPAAFDVASVDNMRRLVAHAGLPGHVYPLALLCHDIMPPPPRVEKEIGEKRLLSFHGAGLSVEPSINHDDFDGDKSEEEIKLAYAKALHDSVCAQYEVLKTAIKGKQGLGASTSTVSLSQPWIKL